MTAPGARAARWLGAPAAVLLAALAAAGLSTQPVAADTRPGDDFGEPTAEQLDRAVIDYAGAEAVRTFAPHVVPLEQTRTTGEQTTLILTADILFAPDSWELAPAAGDRIATLVQDVPEGAEVAVSGHTDSVVGAVDNQQLSERRAEAVAAVVADARADLDLQVDGFADSRPAQVEDPDDPSTRAANRRVEIAYTG